MTKPFVIPKALVWDAFQRVKANGGSAGVDAESIDAFEKNLGDNLYKLWNRMGSTTSCGSGTPPSSRSSNSCRAARSGTRSSPSRRRVACMNSQRRTNDSPPSRASTPGTSTSRAWISVRSIRLWPTASELGPGGSVRYSRGTPTTGHPRDHASHRSPQSAELPRNSPQTPPAQREQQAADPRRVRVRFQGDAHPPLSFEQH
jgi:hypothetical protein